MLRCLILWCILFSVNARLHYDCMRNGGDGCKYGGSCHYFGFCKCPKTFKSYNCGVRIKAISSTVNCTVKCKNGGTCYDKNRCHCDENFVGALCEIPKTVARCAADRVVIEAYRPTGFVGHIYISPKSRICSLKRVPSDIRNMNKYVLEIPHRSKRCPIQQLIDTPEYGDVSYRTTVISTYNYNEFGPRDEILVVSCVQPIVFEGSSADVTESSFPFRMMALDRKGDPVQALAANESIILQFESVGMGDVKGVMVEYLEVYSINARSNEVVSKTIVEKGCVLNHSQGYLDMPIENYTAKSKDGRTWVARVSMKAFILLPGEPLLFKSRLRFCQNRCTGVFVCEKTKNSEYIQWFI